jgi:hypothetical protein
MAKVRKKDGSVRVCGTFSAANEALIPEKDPCRLMDERTEKVAGFVVFSKIALLRGYLQLRLTLEVRYLTASVSLIAVFQNTSFLFGLVTGPSSFHRVIRKILKSTGGLCWLTG